MSEKIVQLNEGVIKGQVKELVRGNVEEALNRLLEAEAVTSAMSSARDTGATTTTGTLQPSPEVTH